MFWSSRLANMTAGVWWGWLRSTSGIFRFLFFFWILIRDIDVDDWNPALTSWGKGSFSRYLQGFSTIPGGWPDLISSINSIAASLFLDPFKIDKLEITPQSFIPIEDPLRRNLTTWTWHRTPWKPPDPRKNPPIFPSICHAVGWPCRYCMFSPSFPPSTLATQEEKIRRMQRLYLPTPSPPEMTQEIVGVFRVSCDTPKNWKGRQ